MLCQNSGEPIPVQRLLFKKNSICLIQASKGMGTGFFIKFPFPSFDHPLYGIMTNNHVLDAEQLSPHSYFTIVADSSERRHRIFIDDNLFLFTSELIDVTFVQLHQDVIRRINPEFLYPGQDSHKEDRVVVLQHPHGGELSFSQGMILSDWGFDYLHTCSTDYGSSGSPLLNNYFEVVGIHKMRRVSEKANVATRISVIQHAIKNMYNLYIKRRSTKGRHPAQMLNSNEIDILRIHGLKSTELDNLFISPSSFFVTTLLFYRTNHAWYWTPLASVEYKVECLKQCNWSIINENHNIKAIGGKWDGIEPAQRNIRLIKWLSSSGLEYL